MYKRQGLHRRERQVQPGGRALLSWPERCQREGPLPGVCLRSSGAHQVCSYMEFLDIAIALLTLITLEVVLGIDNIIFISILADKLPRCV